MENKNDILDMELNEQEAERLAEEIQSWKEETVAKLEEEAEARIQAKIDELEEQSNVWKEEVAEAYSDKFIAALSEMREDVRAEILAESVESDPTHKVLEEVMRLVAPLMNEEYAKNTYMSEIKTLSEKIAAYEKRESLAEGREVLEELIAGYDDSFKPALRVLIGEGTAEEVTAKFEAMVESLNDVPERAIEVEEDFDFEDESFEEDFDFEDEEGEEFEEGFDFEGEDLEEGFDFEDEDLEESEEASTVIDEEFEDDQDGEAKKNNVLRESMMRLF